MRTAALLLPVCFLLASCSTLPDPLPTTKAERSLLAQAESTDPAEAERARGLMLNEHPDWDRTTKTAVLNGQVSPGMTRLQVRAAWGSGQRYVYGGGDSDFLSLRHPERWAYDRPPLFVIARFENDSLIRVGAFDSDEKEVALPRGEFGLLLPAVTAEQPTQTIDHWIDLIHRADRAERNWK